ncbi:PIG-L family deacetylase [Acidimicrobiia bacterium EGI L10123]|uniref:PIG-L deacetylase family protein n=1 Tax=Salinilacustrithrix flava TaxID=2957203 RepID=UPI003D7C25D7|nr:PIG-L family deacetylase [Acidimicrobiia bacterium EGI L10123]
MTTLRITHHLDARTLGTVLGVWAHPDDEAYLSAGLMALARDAGNHVTCVTATLGEHGTDDPGTWPPVRLARTRRMEIAASMAILGVTDHRILGYEDGTLPQQELEPAVGAIAAVIEEVRPDTIVTFGPDGMTGHPDHQTVSAWTTAAWARTGRGRLLHATTTDTFAEEHAALHEEIPVFGPGLPLRTPPEEVALAVDLDDELLDRKLAALRAQATQVGPVLALMGERAFRCWWRTEAFRDADTARVAPLPAAVS